MRASNPARKRKARRLSLLLQLFAVFFFASLLSGQEAPQPGNQHTWFSVPVALKELPPNCDQVPVETSIDFTSLLEKMPAQGLVDTRSLRLIQLNRLKEEKEIAVQFTPSAQPPARTRSLLPGTSPQVSYPAEFAASDTPGDIRVNGRLCWLADADPDGNARYRLEFGIPREHSAVQVPYPPYNLIHFDVDHRSSPFRTFSRMQIRPQQPLDGVISVYELDKLVASYHIGPTANEAKSGTPKFRRPFFYPVNGKDGVSLTEFGKPHDPTGSHAHHYSLWIAHASIDGRDFWSEQGGLILHDGFEDLEDGPVFCRIVQKLRWGFENADVLHERRQITFYERSADWRILDFDLEFTPAASKSVQLGKTNFGFLAARVAQSLSPFDGGGEILNSNGDRNEQRAHLKHADWLDQSGPILLNKWAGVAILDHPQNVNYPTAFHCRNDGWAGPSFNLEQPYTIEPGKTLRLKYRVLLHDGNSADARISRRYEEYSATPTVELGPPQKR